jgi:hypothetical protein
MLPIENLFATKPAYSFLCTFGCVCWPNLRPYNTHKLAFRSKQCTFLGYITHHKGYKCLDISIGRVYISRDVVFDETVFPFSTLHPNAGAHLRSEISLLPPSLVYPALIQGSTMDVTNLPKSTNPSMQQCALPEFPGAAMTMKKSVIAPGDSYFLAAVDTPVMDPAVTEDVGMHVDADPIDSPSLPSPSDREQAGLSDPVLDSVPTRPFPLYHVTRRPRPDPLCLRPRLLFLRRWPHQWLPLQLIHCLGPLVRLAPGLHQQMKLHPLFHNSGAVLDFKITSSSPSDCFQA